MGVLWSWFFPPWGLQGTNSGCQVWWQVPFPPSHCWPQKTGLTSQIIVKGGKLFKTNWNNSQTHSKLLCFWWQKPSSFKGRGWWVAPQVWLAFDLPLRNCSCIGVFFSSSFIRHKHHDDTKVSKLQIFSPRNSNSRKGNRDFKKKLSKFRALVGIWRPHPSLDQYHYDSFSETVRW